MHDSGPVKHGLDWSNLCPQLEHLGVFGFPKLKFLSLRRSFIPQSTTPDVLSFFLKNAENIEGIDLQGCSCFNFADLLVGIGPLHRRQRLKSVDFSGTIAKNEDDFNRFFNVQGLDCAIEDLSLSGIKTKANAEDFYLPFINKFVLHADRLKNLDLGRFENLKFVSFIQYFQNKHRKRRSSITPRKKASFTLAHIIWMLRYSAIMEKNNKNRRIFKCNSSILRINFHHSESNNDFSILNLVEFLFVFFYQIHVNLLIQFEIVESLKIWLQPVKRRRDFDLSTLTFQLARLRLCLYHRKMLKELLL